MLLSFQHDQRIRANIGIKLLADRDQIAQKAHRVIVALVQCQPANRNRRISDPLADQMRFPKSCRCRNQYQPTLYRLTEPLQQSLAPDKRNTQPWMCHFGMQDFGDSLLLIVLFLSNHRHSLSTLLMRTAHHPCNMTDSLMVSSMSSDPQ